MIESDLIRSALKEVTARNEVLEHQLSCSVKREAEQKDLQKARIRSIEEANEAFLEEKNKQIQSLTRDGEEEADRAARAEKENRHLLGELESKKKQMSMLARRYEKMAAAMSALQRVVCESMPVPESPLETNDIELAPKVKHRSAIRESTELCLTTFKDLSKALDDAGIKVASGLDNPKAEPFPFPAVIEHTIPQPSMQRVKSRDKPSTHDLVAAALQGHVSDSLAYEANALFSSRQDVPRFPPSQSPYKIGSAQAAVAGAISDLRFRDQ